MSSRADERLVELGLVPSRARAQAEIKAGTVTADGKRIAKPSEKLAPSAVVEIAAPENPWVSRGGLKLAHGLEHFGIDVTGAIALDVGASTGGFTQVLLARGARRVYAVDVGRGQFHVSLREDPRVTVLESQDARGLDARLVPEPVSIIVSDVSFISLMLALPAALALAAPKAKLVALVKPQFELGPGATSKGIVRDEAARRSAIQAVSSWIERQGWRMIGETPSPIRGGDGNEEFLLPPRTPDLAPETELTIERLGHLGDGIAEAGGRQVLVPLTAPGDHVRFADGAWQLAAAGPERQEAPCPHFGVCGGCSLQHVVPETYARAKREWVIAALANQGLETQVDPLVTIPPRTRRRAAFTVRRREQGIEAGFLTRRGDEVVAIPGCLVLRPRLRDALPALANLVGSRLKFGRSATLTVTDAIGGLDVAVEAQDKAPSLDAGAAATARQAGVARLTWNGEIVAGIARPHIDLSDVPVDLPPGAFLQATAEAEAHLVERVRTILHAAKAVADLYAGVGTFAFALARDAKVSAFESDGAAVEALTAAMRHAQGLKPITTEKRDLVRRPLMPQELKRFDGVVIDPPRTGAETQARALANSVVPRIAYVSCQPASFARDARLLVEGGYKLARVTPVDQFVWSHHVELVGAFARPRR